MCFHISFSAIFDLFRIYFYYFFSVTRSLVEAMHIFGVSPALVPVNIRRPRRRRQTIHIDARPMMTKKLTQRRQTDQTTKDEIWCICRQRAFGKMIGCDGPSCLFEWFHYCYVDVKRAPKGQWICPNCAISRKNIKK